MEGSDRDGGRRVSWKEMGLRFSMRIEDLKNGLGHLNFSLRFSNGAHAGREVLTKSDIVSTTQFRLGQTFLLVLTQVQQNALSSSVPFYLDKLPILGPLFGQKQNQEAQSFLYALARIDQLGPDDGLAEESLNLVELGVEGNSAK